MNAKKAPKQLFTLDARDADYLVGLLGLELEGLEERISECDLPQNAQDPYWGGTEKERLTKERAFVEALVVRLGGQP